MTSKELDRRTSYAIFLTFLLILCCFLYWAAIFLKHDEKKLDAKTMRKILESSDKKKFMQKFSNEYYQDMFDEAVGT